VRRKLVFLCRMAVIACSVVSGGDDAKLTRNHYQLCNEFKLFVSIVNDFLHRVSVLFNYKRDNSIVFFFIGGTLLMNIQ
jgi:hypothetical protein